MSDMEARLRRVEDLLEIAQLRAHYCHVLDGRRWDELAELFTEDGVFDGLARAEGRAAIHRFFSQRVPSLGEGFWHFCTNGVAEIEGDRATGRISMEYLSVKDGVSYVSAGHYDDVLARVDGRWRFRERRIEFYYFAPLSEGFVGRPERLAPEPAAPDA